MLAKGTLLPACSCRFRGTVLGEAVLLVVSSAGKHDDEDAAKLSYEAFTSLEMEEMKERKAWSLYRKARWMP